MAEPGCFVRAAKARSAGGKEPGVAIAGAGAVYRPIALYEGRGAALGKEGRQRQKIPAGQTPASYSRPCPKGMTRVVGRAPIACLADENDPGVWIARS